MIIQHYIELLRYHRKQLITLIIVTVMAFGLVNTAKLLLAPIYTAAATVTIIPTQAEMAFSEGGTHRKEAGRVLTETYIEYVKSRPVILAAIEEIEAGQEIPAAVIIESRWDEYITRIKDIKSTIRRWFYILNYGTYISLPEEEKKIEKIRKAIEVKNVTNTHILRIEVNLPNPEMAARLANTLAERFVERMSRELNDEAEKLEQYLDGEIKLREASVAALRKKLAAYKKRYGILPENSSEQTQLGILEQQLIELHARLMSTRLSRTSGTKVHLVEAAVIPVYPSSPQVLKNTLLGLLTGIVLGLIMIVVRDSATNRIVTSADLQRIAGARGLGVMKRAWVRSRNWRALRRMGIVLERRLAIFGDLDIPAPPPEVFPSSVKLITREEHQAPVHAHANLPQIKQIEDIDPAEDPYVRPVLQVTGMADMATVCWATVGLAAALAVQGRKVICKLPAGVIKKRGILDTMEKWKSGRIRFSDEQPAELAKKLGILDTMEKWKSGRTHASDDRQEVWAGDILTVECLGPLTADLNLTEALQKSPAVVCILPVNRIQEEMVEALQHRITMANQANVSFMLMA